ncbi:MAG: citrate synthase-like protein [Actinomycetia bacterium]|nr:citrate synthase-like protein [Actinomycetes bacterium]
MRPAGFLVNVDYINAWVTTEEACQRLGVRPQTLYAYVSRGRLTPRKEGRRSRFSVDELDRLAASGRRGTRQARLEVLIDTEVTLLDPRGRLYYRGVDAVALATRWSYERTAEWLWSGRDTGEPAPWSAPEPWIALARAVPGTRPADRVRVAVAAIAAERDEVPAGDTGRRLVPALVAALPLVHPARTARIAGIDRDDPIAARLWPRLSPLAPTPARLKVLNAALVLVADHELAVSTVAARVASSSWAPPVDCVLAGLAAHGGALHGGVTTAVQRAMVEGRAGPSGFGHGVYLGDDPRAVALLALLREVATPAQWRPVARALATGEHPNVDLALAGMAVAFDMVDGAGEAVFALARVAGWLAHAAEEHDRPFRFRPRASYVGVRPID